MVSVRENMTAGLERFQFGAPDAESADRGGKNYDKGKGAGKNEGSWQVGVALHAASGGRMLQALSCIATRRARLATAHGVSV